MSSVVIGTDLLASESSSRHGTFSRSFKEEIVITGSTLLVRGKLLNRCDHISLPVGKAANLAPSQVPQNFDGLGEYVMTFVCVTYVEGIRQVSMQLHLCNAKMYLFSCTSDDRVFATNSM